MLKMTNFSRNQGFQGLHFKNRPFRTVQFGYEKFLTLKKKAFKCSQTYTLKLFVLHYSVTRCATRAGTDERIDRFNRILFGKLSILMNKVIKLFLIKLIMMSLATGSCSPIYGSSFLSFNNNTITSATNSKSPTLSQNASQFSNIPPVFDMRLNKISSKSNRIIYEYHHKSYSINDSNKEIPILQVSINDTYTNSTQSSTNGNEADVDDDEEENDDFIINKYQSNFSSYEIHLRPLVTTSIRFSSTLIQNQSNNETIYDKTLNVMNFNNNNNNNNNNNSNSNSHYDMYNQSFDKIEETNNSLSIRNDAIESDSEIQMPNLVENNSSEEQLNESHLSVMLSQMNQEANVVVDDDFLSLTNFNVLINNLSNPNSNITFSNRTYDNIILSKNNTPKSYSNNQEDSLQTLSRRLVSNRSFQVNEVFENAKKHSFNVNGHNRNPNNRTNGRIVILGLFELSTKYGERPEGLSELGAAKMAVEHINRKNLLPGYTIELITNDTQCDPGVGVDRFFHALYTQHSTRMVMLLGSACSEVTESLAKIVPYWNIVQVSFGSTSPALSDRHEFPFFYRTVAPDSSHNPARIAFIRKFGWDTVTTFSQNEEVHSLAVNDLVTELESSNISCAATITFAETDFKEQLLLLRELDTRIIIGSFSKELAPKIFCEAHKLGMFGADYAWILHESMSPPWLDRKSTKLASTSSSSASKRWDPKQIFLSERTSTAAASAGGSKSSSGLYYNADCLHYQLMEAVENLIIVSSHNSIVGNQIGLSGLNNDMFVNELNRMRVPKPMSKYAPQTYDAVWAIALALSGAENHWNSHRKNASKLDSFDYTRYDMALEFLQQMGKLDFLGVSGPVSFSGPDRIGTTAFYQVQKGNLEQVALYYPSEKNLDFNCPNCKAIKWYSGQVPIAKRVFKLKVVTIAPLAFYTIATLSSFGIALAIAFLAFNLHFRKLKAIKLSSPKLSNITAFGCILVYMAVILLGLDFATLPRNEGAFATVCTARVYLLSAGFSLAFGSMFAKTYRVHRIFTRSGSGVCKDKMLQDTQLISLVCALLILDGLVVTLWIVMDPIERHLNNLTLEISSTDRSVVYQPQVEVCRSQHTQSWLGILYAYKGLLLIVGVYMAWETRHVKIPALNDSQYIGVSVYSVVITSAIVVVLANLISGRVTLAFITITTFILTSTTATLCLLFIPKLHDIIARNDIVDPVIHSMGLKMECNTRRFVIDDKRELQYRVEVQNRVYKREILALDAEIHRLEKLLDSNSSVSTLSNTSIFIQNKPEVNITAESAGSVRFNAKSAAKNRTPSITGGLPYLLLSVLPPVIPRASWPSAEYMQVPMRRSVTFASHPQLEDKRSVAEVCLPAADLLNLRLAHQQATAETKGGIINRIRGIFSRNSSSNRGSSTSLSNNQTSLKAAFKSHMGMFSRLIPSSETTASCNALYNTNKNLEPQSTMHNLSSLAKSSTDIDRTQADPSFLCSKSSFKEQLGCFVKSQETKVNFQLPIRRRSSIVMQNNNQPSLRERVRGSPRFPHRILPTSSLSALEEQDTPKVKTKLHATSSNWKSMEVPSVSSAISFENNSLSTLVNENESLTNKVTLPLSLEFDTNTRVEAVALDHIIIVTESET